MVPPCSSSSQDVILSFRIRAILQRAAPYFTDPIHQVRVLPIGDASEYVAKVEALLKGIVLQQPLKYNELRFKFDCSS